MQKKNDFFIIFDKLLVEIQMSHEEFVRCKQYREKEYDDNKRKNMR